jgi:hypothetical protein
LLGGERFTATLASPNFIADNNAPVKAITATGTSTTTFSANSIGGNVNYATSRITITGHTYADGDPVKYVSSPNTAIDPLVNAEVYYVNVYDANNVLLGSLASASPSQVTVLNTSSNLISTLTVNPGDTSTASPSLFSAGNIGYTSSDCTGVPLVVARVNGNTSQPNDLNAFDLRLSSLQGNGNIVWYETANGSNYRAVLPTVYSKVYVDDNGNLKEYSPRQPVKLGSTLFTTQTVALGAAPVQASTTLIGSLQGTIESSIVAGNTYYTYIPGNGCTALSVTSDPGVANSLPGALWDLYTAVNWISGNQTRWVMNLESTTLPYPASIKLPFTFK